MIFEANSLQGAKSIFELKKIDSFFQLYVFQDLQAVLLLVAAAFMLPMNSVLQGPDH